MKSKLRPRHDFEKFLESANAAGHRDESIGQFRHHRLAFVHGFHHAQILDAFVTKFLGHERLGNHADHLAARRKHPVRDYAHQTDVATAIHERNTASRQFTAKIFRRFSVRGIRAVAGAAENAEALECARSRHHTNPVVSANPQRIFMLCTACPLAPFTRLSSALITMSRPVRGSSRHAISMTFVPATFFVSGNALPSSNRTNGSWP